LSFSNYLHGLPIDDLPHFVSSFLFRLISFGKRTSGEMSTAEPGGPTAPIITDPLATCGKHPETILSTLEDDGSNDGDSDADGDSIVDCDAGVDLASLVLSVLDDGADHQFLSSKNVKRLLEETPEKAGLQEVVGGLQIVADNFYQVGHACLWLCGSDVAVAVGPGMPAGVAHAFLPLWLMHSCRCGSSIPATAVESQRRKEGISVFVGQEDL
jgi:hypothetical protein